MFAGKSADEIISSDWSTKHIVRSKGDFFLFLTRNIISWKTGDFKLSLGGPELLLE